MKASKLGLVWHVWLRSTTQQMFCQEEQTLKNYGTTVDGGTDHLGWQKVRSYDPTSTLL